PPAAPGPPPLADRRSRATAAGPARAGDAAGAGTDRDHVEIIARHAGSTPILGCSAFWLSQPAARRKGSPAILQPAWRIRRCPQLMVEAMQCRLLHLQGNQQ